MLTIFNIIHFVGIVIITLLCCLVLFDKSSSRERVFVLIGIAILVQMVGYLFEINSIEIETAVVAIKFQLLGMLFFNSYLIAFARKLLNPDYNRFSLIPFVLIDFIFAIFFLGHQFQYVMFDPVIVETGFFPHLVYRSGIVLYLNVIFNIGCSIYQGILIIMYFKKNKKIGKAAFLIIIAYLLPLFISFLVCHVKW